MCEEAGERREIASPSTLAGALDCALPRCPSFSPLPGHAGTLYSRSVPCSGPALSLLSA